MRPHLPPADLWVQPEELVAAEEEDDDGAAATCTAGQTFVGCLGGTLVGYIALLLSCGMGIIVCIVVSAFVWLLFVCLIKRQMPECRCSYRNTGVSGRGLDEDSI